MNDLIDRQAAIDALRSCQTYLFNSKDPDKKIELRSAEMAIEELPTVQPEPHWIPCSERLPEESGKYLVTVLDGIGKRTTSAPYHLRSRSWTLTGRMTYWKVIAWMPLPEPYRGGGKE